MNVGLEDQSRETNQSPASDHKKRRERGREREREEKSCGPVWPDENLMWVQLLAGPRALESSMKVSSKSGAPTRGSTVRPLSLWLFFKPSLPA